MKLRKEEKPRKGSEESQVEGAAQKVTSREPLLTWPGVACYFEAPGSGCRREWGPSRPGLGLKLSFTRDHPLLSEAVLPFRRPLPIGKFALKNMEQKQIVLFQERLGNN